MRDRLTRIVIMAVFTELDKMFRTPEFRTCRPGIAWERLFDSRIDTAFAHLKTPASIAAFQLQAGDEERG